MKKIRLISVIALALVAIMALSSCGAESIMTKIINPDYDLSDDLYTTETDVSDLEGFSFVSGNGNFAIFSQMNAKGFMTQKVYSLSEGSVVATRTNSEKITHTITLRDDAPMFCVASLTLPTLADLEADVEYKVYDTKGTLLMTADNAEDVVVNQLSNGDFVFDGVVYSIDDNGSMVKEFDIPEYVSATKFTKFTENNYYSVDDNVAAVYDKDFKLLAVWEAPSYAEQVLVNVLNDGNLFIQYWYALEENAEEYDIFMEDVKYDLVSVLFNVEKNKAKELKDIDYIVDHLYTYEDLYDDEKEINENKFIGEFDNLASIVYIENYRVNTQSAAVVLMNNKLDIRGTFQCFPEQDLASVPTKIADNRYMVSTKSGERAIIDFEGNLIGMIDAGSLDVCGNYLVGDKAIYDTDLNVVYDLKANEAEVISTIGDTVFVKAGGFDEDEYEMITLRNGAQNTIYTYDKDSKKQFKLIDGVGYCIYITDGTYKFYNASGAEILSTKYDLTLVAMSDYNDSAIFTGVDKNVIVYHKFDVAK